MRAALRSTSGSILSWCSLFVGLILIADLALTQPLARLNESSALLYEERFAFDQLRDETARAERISSAIASDPIFRDEWLRREWGIDLPETIEQVRVEERLQLRQPAASSAKTSDLSSPRPSFRPWAPPFDVTTAVRYPRLVIVLLLAVGILAPSLLSRQQRLA